jgi:hypothetical protein
MDVMYLCYFDYVMTWTMLFILVVRVSIILCINYCAFRVLVDWYTWRDTSCPTFIYLGGVTSFGGIRARFHNSLWLESV